MADKILFLDIDGVLCTHRTMMQRHPGTWVFDPVGIGLLQRLFTDFEGWKIVMSSTWRFSGGAGAVLRSHGLMNVHSDHATPRRLPDQTRGLEIQEWIDAHNGISAYLILDDEISDISPYHSSEIIVQTEHEYGITYKNYERMRRIMEAAQ